MNLQKLEADYQIVHEDEPRLMGFAWILGMVGVVLIASGLLAAGWAFSTLSAGFGG